MNRGCVCFHQSSTQEFSSVDDDDDSQSAMRQYENLCKHLVNMTDYRALYTASHTHNNCLHKKF